LDSERRTAILTFGFWSISQHWWTSASSTCKKGATIAAAESWFPKWNWTISFLAESGSRDLGLPQAKLLLMIHPLSEPSIWQCKLFQWKSISTTKLQEDLTLRFPSTDLRVLLTSTWGAQRSMTNLNSSICQTLRRIWPGRTLSLMTTSFFAAWNFRAQSTRMMEGTVHQSSIAKSWSAKHNFKSLKSNQLTAIWTGTLSRILILYFSKLRTISSTQSQPFVLYSHANSQSMSPNCKLT
jgi:hypothetical protein